MLSSVDRAPPCLVVTGLVVTGLVVTGPLVNGMGLDSNSFDRSNTVRVVKIVQTAFSN